MDLIVILKALADENRLRIIKMLLRHGHFVRELAEELEISESATSQHLRVLKEAKLVVGIKRQYHMHYQVDREALKALSAYIYSISEIKRERHNHHNMPGQFEGQFFSDEKQKNRQEEGEE